MPIYSPPKPKQLRYVRAAVIAIACTVLALFISLFPLHLFRLSHITDNGALHFGLTTSTETSRLSRNGVTLAYFIQVSGSNHPRLPFLLRALCDPGTHTAYAVHFDKSMSHRIVSTSTQAAHAALQLAGCASTDMHLIPREHVTYRGITLTHNIISAATHLLRTGISFDYFINLSASDYPTARPHLIRKLLSIPDVTRHRLSFVAWSKRETWPRFTRMRLATKHIDSALASGGRGTFFRNVDTNDLMPHVDFTVAKSSSWFILTREMVEHFVLDAKARRMLSVFAFSDIGDEHYFATVMWNNTYFRQRAVSANFRNIFFNAPNGSAALAADGVTRSTLHPYFVDDVDEEGNLLFWDALAAKPAFFTRKLRRMDGLLTDKIDAHMLGIASEITEEDRRRRAEYEKKLDTIFQRVVKRHLENNPEVTTDTLQPFTSAFAQRT